MPIFDNEFTFIHIPKCGGTTIEKFLVDKGYNMSLFTSSGSIFINGHTPQHCTYLELKELGLVTDKIFTIIRPEMERVVSEYFYILENRPDIKELFNGFDGFLDIFLDKKNNLIFDNHNLSNLDFLINEEGRIDQSIKIFDFFNYEEIEDYIGIKGLNRVHEMKSVKNNFNLNESQIKKINEFYGLV